MLFSPKNKRIYLDHAAATPVRKEVLKAMEPYWQSVFGNAGAIHQEGAAAKRAIEEARTSLARVLHVRPEGVVFTGSGTESNNLAIMGIVKALHAKGMAYADMEVVTTSIEHPSVSSTLSELRCWGVSVVTLPLGEDGLVDVSACAKVFTPKTVLVACAYVNSEIGVIEPVGKIARLAKEAARSFGTHIYMHVDAAQAPLWLSCELDKLGADTLALDAGKCYGPKGVGVLAFAHGVSFLPVTFGGAQEGGLRPGTENTPLIVGASKALITAQGGYKERSEKVAKKRNTFIEKLLALEGVFLNGSRTHRVANNINISIPGIDSEFAVIVLDEKGIACSTKSACGGAKGDGSSVVRALTGDEARARSTLRFTLGEETTDAELHTAYVHLRDHLAKTRASLRG